MPILLNQVNADPQKDAKVQKVNKSEKTQDEPATKVGPQKGVEEIKTEEISITPTSKENSLKGTLLEEASKMLRVINVPKDEEKKEADKIQEKKRLEELRKERQATEAGSWKPSMKMFRSMATVARIKTGCAALLDKAATHAMRPRKTNEELGGELGCRWDYTTMWMTSAVEPWFIKISRWSPLSWSESWSRNC